MNTVSSSLSYAEDFANAADTLISEATKQVFLVQVTNDQVGFNDSSASRVITSTRITIADGYRPFVAQQDTPFDGYLYPCVKQLGPGEIKLYSNAQLSSNTFLIGPIVFPYTFNGISYGLDPLATFQPQINSNINSQVYIQLFGVGLPSSTNFFAIKKIVLTGKGIHPGLTYKLLVEQAAVNVS